jgi:dCTP diphosphatase
MTAPVGDPLVGLREELSLFAPEHDWDWLYAPKNLAAALSVAAAELLEPFQWLTDEESAELSPRVHARVAEDMADVLVYLVLLARRFDVDLLAVAREKLAGNPQETRFKEGRGSSGD